MGKSITINCIGRAPIDSEHDRMFDAMNRLEIMQAQAKAKKEGLVITEWYAQTATGCKVLGMDKWSTHVYIPHDAVPTVKTVTCPICNGQGSTLVPGEKCLTWCFVCHGSGITKNNHWNGWQDWQLARMRTKFAA
jgi:hypothetical protein